MLQKCILLHKLRCKRSVWQDFLWKSRVDGRRCLFFIDNQGGRDAFIKGYSVEETMKDLFVELESMDSEDPCLPWYCRVPSTREGGTSYFQCFRIASKCIPYVLFYSRKLQVIEEKSGDS